MKKIIIFGATGNVGSYVLKYAREYFDPAEYTVIASGRRKTDFFEKRGIPYYSVDISKSEEFEKLPKEDVYAVIYLAAQIPSYMVAMKPEKYIQSNIIGRTMYWNTVEKHMQTVFYFLLQFLIFLYMQKMALF